MNNNVTAKIGTSSGLPIKKFFSGIVLVAISIQMFSFAVSAQKFSKEQFGQAVKGETEKVVPQMPDANSKISPDLSKSSDSFFRGSKADRPERVIIQLKEQDTETVDSGNLLSDFNSSGEINAKLSELGGNIKKTFSSMKMIAAELPLSKIRELSSDENIEYISPDRKIKGTDNKFSHYFKTTGALDGFSEVSGLDADGTGIGVAVLDSGIDISHRLMKSEGGHPGVVYSKSFTGLSATDDKYGHGTHVASLLSAGKKFGKGAYGGIAPGVKIINLAVLDANGSGSMSSAIAAIDWVIANKSTYNIRVINMSLGTPAVDSYVNDPLCRAVRRAFNTGIVVVVAAGNVGKDDLGNKMYGSINSPGIEPSAITVGAANSFGSDLRQDDAIASYSSKGPTRGYQLINGVKKYDNLIKPDIVAPGNKLISAISTSSRGSSTSILRRNPSLDTRNSTKSGEGLMYMSGTSMAAPLVSGAVAMMLQANPNLTPNLVKATLMFTAQQMNGYNTFEQGAGLLNIKGTMTITKFIRSNVASLQNGASMMTGSSNPFSTLGNETIYWSKGILTNHASLSGDNLMTYYQGMYGNGVLMSDSTPFINGVLTRSLTMTSVGVTVNSGSMTGNGVLMSDGIPFLNGNSMGDGLTLGTGVLISDGTLIGDGVLISDNVGSLSILGDPTAGMQLED